MPLGGRRGAAGQEACLPLLAAGGISLVLTSAGCEGLFLLLRTVLSQGTAPAPTVASSPLPLALSQALTPRPPAVPGIIERPFTSSHAMDT